MSGRRLRREDLAQLVGLYARVTVGDESAEGVISGTGYGAFGGLFVEFQDGETRAGGRNREASIGWNPEDSPTITLGQEGQS
jgi:hypothetical protein